MQIKFFKAMSLPAILEPDSFYYIAGSGHYAQAYLTDSTGTAMAIGNSTMINAHILANSNVNHPMRVVNNIGEMSAITGPAAVTMMVLVLDASGDPTVTEGSALYAYDSSTRITHKVSAYADLDLELNWLSIEGRPQSQVTDIDDAVASRHIHYNMEVLEKWSEEADSGAPLYDGERIEPAWETKNW